MGLDEEFDNARLNDHLDMPDMVGSAKAKQFEFNFKGDCDTINYDHYLNAGSTSTCLKKETRFTRKKYIETSSTSNLRTDSK